MNQSQASLTTSCRNCVFQILNSQGFQVGCHGQNVQDEKLLDYNDPDWHFAEKICQFKRSREWAENKKTSDPDSLWRSARKEVTPKYSVIRECKTAKEALAFYKHCYSHGIKPEVVYLCFRDEKEQQSFISIKDKGGGVWNATFIPFDFTVYQSMIPAIKTHFMWFTQDEKLPKQMFQWLDHEINDNGFRFAHISNEKNIILSKVAYQLHELPILEFKKRVKGYEYDLISELAARNIKWTSKLSTDGSKQSQPHSCCGSDGGRKTQA